jgi:hypothetical protein
MEFWRPSYFSWLRPAKRSCTGDEHAVAVLPVEVGRLFRCLPFLAAIASRVISCCAERFEEDREKLAL